MADQETTTPTNQVMDIQPPKAADTTIVPSTSAQDTPVATEPESTGTSQSTEPVASPEPSVTPEVKADTPLAVPMGTKTAHHSRLPMGAIISAVVVAVALTGLTVFAFEKSKTDSRAALSGQKSTPSVSYKAADVDQASRDVDASLQGVDDTKDLTTNDLSDATLGL